MKKYLLIFIVPLLFFSVGCEEDDEITLQETVLDLNLIGNWRYESGNYLEYLTFSNDGNYGWFDSSDSHTGTWWVEGGFIWVHRNDGGSYFYIYYIVNDNHLNITDQNGNEQEFIRIN